MKIRILYCENCDRVKYRKGVATKMPCLICKKPTVKKVEFDFTDRGRSIGMREL